MQRTVPNCRRRSNHGLPLFPRESNANALEGLRQKLNRLELLPALTLLDISGPALECLGSGSELGYLIAHRHDRRTL